MIVLTVLDYEDGLVYQYDIETDKELQAEDFEDIMLERGHRPNTGQMPPNCHWMTHSDDTLNKIKIEL